MSTPFKNPQQKGVAALCDSPLIFFFKQDILSRLLRICYRIVIELFNIPARLLRAKRYNNGCD